VRQPGGDEVRSIEELQGFCRLDDETGCWVWVGGTHAGKPAIWCSASRKSRSAGRVLHLMHRGHEAPPGRVYWAKCLNSMCVNPAHRTLGTSGDCARANFRSGKPPDVVARMTRAARAKVAMTQETADAIRSADGPMRDIAESHGVSLKTVWRIKRGLRWAPVVSAASVFAWRP
jgi:hypothetical protein